ncbi:MAG: DUF2147 domain-containing protein [Alphaproteobacteria bacterium]|nr:DUF2147 domain-containing protein [Alphaproteobacteria bacterium]
MKSRLFAASCLISLFLSGHSFAQAVTPQPQEEEIKAVTGFWLTDDKDGVVEIYACGENVCGRFHWLEDDSPENPSLDGNNPDPKKRKEPMCGLQFMGGFAPDGRGRFADGWIYSPRDGSTYSASLTLRNEKTLELRGYMLIPLFGESRYWQRTGPEPSCQTDKSVNP